MNDIAKWLKERDGWTQKALANALEVCRLTVLKAKNNPFKSLSKRTQIRIDDLKKRREEDERMVDMQNKWT